MVFERTSNENAARGKFADKSRNTFSDSFLSFSASVLNTPIMLLDPETNHNGTLLIAANIAEVGVATPFFVLLCQNHIPLTQADGDAVLTANNIGTTIASTGLSSPIYIEPNKGLFLFPLVAATSGVRQLLFRRL